jgi:hypothetical protein
VSPEIDVIGGALSSHGSDDSKSKRPTHSPTQFLLDLARFYRNYGRTRPIMDALALHPYLIGRQQPGVQHPDSTTITISDYSKLRSLLERAFAGTQQPAADLPILYAEFGVQTPVPQRKLYSYVNRRAPAHAVVSEQLQAAYYTQVLAMAQCQPNVLGLFFFHVSDEENLAAWQSGVYYADDTPKSSLPAIRDAALAARAGTLANCPG